MHAFIAPAFGMPIVPVAVRRAWPRRTRWCSAPAAVLIVSVGVSVRVVSTRRSRAVGLVSAVVGGADAVVALLAARSGQAVEQGR
jgi:hypothetical protein